jgi:hypothetical protein
MPRMGFESTIPLFERAKTFPALDRAANIIGDILIYYTLICMPEDYYTWNKWTSNKHRIWLLEYPKVADKEYTKQKIQFSKCHIIIFEEMPRFECLFTESSKYAR